ncbi:MAG: 6-hydroxymethylpterin diphosphokinase MptE-like protein [Candidatus Korarchaeum sp.]
MREVDLAFWLPIYFSIAERLKLDVAADRCATRLMDLLMEGKRDLTDSLEDLMRGERVLVIGNGPSLREADLSEGLVVAADAAAHSYLTLTRREPHVIVSDLDGPPEILGMRSIKVVHAHGDNMAKLLRAIPKLGELVATTQVEPTPRVHNFGGFTDGDRAVFLACAAGASSIRLAGFDFDSISDYDIVAGKDIYRKREKLKIAKELIGIAIKMGCPLEVGASWR